jgi:methionine-gamma-lyase
LFIIPDKLKFAINSFKIMSLNPANRIEDQHFLGEQGGVNPSISDSSTYAFKTAKEMSDTFESKTEGCYLYSRHTSPANEQLAQTLAAMEYTQSATVTSSGMGAITAVIMQLCSAGDHIISSRTIYGGTYAFMKNFATKFNIETSFIDITDLHSIVENINSNTKVIYCETLSNPLLEVADIRSLGKIAAQNNLKLVVDNTFSPLIISPALLGADVIIHSLTKFINGASDTLGGVICGTEEFINDLKNVNDGACMLFGSTLDSLRSASILKNLRTLAIRMQQHGKNALYLALRFQEDGLRVVYPGLRSHHSHYLLNEVKNEDFGYGGILTIDVGSLEKANALMELMQERNLGYLAVSLGFYKTLFSVPGTSTSSEIPEGEQLRMGLSEGLIRFSIGLDSDIKRTYRKMRLCMEELNILIPELAN